MFILVPIKSCFILLVLEIIVFILINCKKKKLSKCLLYLNMFILVSIFKKYRGCSPIFGCQVIDES